MKRVHHRYKNTIKGLLLATTSALVACSSGSSSSKPATQSGVSPQTMADALHAVMESDRTVSTKKVVNRLANEQNIIKASEHWEDDKALPLPAQMFRMGAEMVTEKNVGFTYGLLSKWPVNKQHAPKTDVEIRGLDFIDSNGGTTPFYGEEELGNQKYFTAIYADVGVATACVKCHNEHKDSPRTDFKIGDVMGGIVIRIPLNS